MLIEYLLQVLLTQGDEDLEHLKTLLLLHDLITTALSSTIKRVNNV